MAGFCFVLPSSCFQAHLSGETYHRRLGKRCIYTSGEITFSLSEVKQPLQIDCHLRQVFALLPSMTETISNELKRNDYTSDDIISFPNPGLLASYALANSSSSHLNPI